MIEPEIDAIDDAWAYNVIATTRDTMYRELVQARGDIHALLAEVRRLREELRVTDELLATRQQVLDAIPPCPTHGSCTPHALAWIARHRTEGRPG